MSPHKKSYCAFFGFTVGDYVESELNGEPAVDIHAIQPDGRGGRKEERNIEELIALTRDQHDKYGNKKQYKHALYHIHLKFIMEKKPEYEIRPEYLQYLEPPEIEINCKNI